MSSIYRKGRDGYFYYQTYLFNDKTGKKDKKIFHSLGTKNRQKAILEQQRLDLFYLKKLNKKNFFKNLSNLKYIIFLFLIASISFKYLFINPKIQIPIDSVPEETPYQIDAKVDSLHKKSYSPAETISEPKEKDLIVSSKQQVDNQISNGYNPKLFKYNVERVEELGNSFSQVKLFITVNKFYNSNSLKILCEDLRRKNSQYSNIIICFYKDSIKGKRLATGKVDQFSQSELKECWVAMYTYNDIEKAYFDDNPTGYLGLKNEKNI
tara:strand:- start:3479 stop:4276 length:798 start_codon:yes stop_codon:yes gene_type:complete